MSGDPRNQILLSQIGSLPDVRGLPQVRMTRGPPLRRAVGKPPVGRTEDKTPFVDFPDDGVVPMEGVTMGGGTELPILNETLPAHAAEPMEGVEQLAERTRQASEADLERRLEHAMEQVLYERDLQDNAQSLVRYRGPQRALVEQALEERPVLPPAIQRHLRNVRPSSALPTIEEPHDNSMAVVPYAPDVLVPARRSSPDGGFDPGRSAKRQRRPPPLTRPQRAAIQGRLRDERITRRERHTAIEDSKDVVMRDAVAKRSRSGVGQFIKGLIEGVVNTPGGSSSRAARSLGFQAPKQIAGAPVRHSTRTRNRLDPRRPPLRIGFR